ncbi:GNAT family N-acetyltransferase [bacterium]|nr:GNAT family N-acetyltransferase [bacterium]
MDFQPFDASKNLDEQRELFVACFPENQNTSSVSKEHYQWKFHTFPAKPHSYEFCGYDQSKMVSYYAALPYRYSIHGEEQLCGMVCDVMTHPNMRGKGVFTKIGHYSTDQLKQLGIDFTSGYPIRPEVIPGHLKVGWKIVFKLPIYIQFYRFNAVFKSKNLSFLSPFANIATACWRLLLKIFERKFGGTFEIIDQNHINKIPGYDSFFEQWKKNIPNALFKTPDFLYWRTHAPGSEYDIILLRDKSGLIGFCLTRFTALEKIPCVAILDWMLLEGKDRARFSLNRALYSLVRRYRAEAVVTMMSPYWAERYGLWKLGFIRSPYAFSMIIKKLNDRISDEKLYNEKDWHLMWIDSDDL